MSGQNPVSCWPAAVSTESQRSPQASRGNRLEHAAPLQEGLKGLESEHRSHDALDGPVVLLHDVVQVFALTQFDVRARVILDALDSRSVGTALAGRRSFTPSLSQNRNRLLQQPMIDLIEGRPDTLPISKTFRRQCESCARVMPLKGTNLRCSAVAGLPARCSCC